MLTVIIKLDGASSIRSAIWTVLHHLSVSVSMPPDSASNIAGQHVSTTWVRFSNFLTGPNDFFLKKNSKNPDGELMPVVVNVMCLDANSFDFGGLPIVSLFLLKAQH